MNTQLVIPDYSVRELALNSRALQLKAEALESSALIPRVTNPDEQQTAVNALSTIKEVINLFENSRKEITAPLLKAQKQLKATVDKESCDLQDEWGRVNDLIVGYQLGERRKAEAERCRQEAELKRIEEEKRRELFKIAQQAELGNISAADAVKQAEVVHAQVENAQAVVSQPIVTAQANGLRVSDDWEIEVTNPYDLARYHPGCILKIEPSLREIKALLNQGVEVRGVKARKIVKVNTR